MRLEDDLCATLPVDCRSSLVDPTGQNLLPRRTLAWEPKLEGERRQQHLARK